VKAHTEHIFSVLVDLDPLASAAADRVAAADGLDETATAERIARIVAQPRPEPTPTRSGSPTSAPPIRTRPHPRLRAGALGLLMSAAIAAVTMLLWASPSGGEPTGRSIDVPAQVSSAHGPLSYGASRLAKVTAGRA
jgi:hypothetical protein